MPSTSNPGHLLDYLSQPVLIRLQVLFHDILTRCGAYSKDKRVNFVLTLQLSSLSQLQRIHFYRKFLFSYFFSSWLSSLLSLSRHCPAPLLKTGICPRNSVFNFSLSDFWFVGLFFCYLKVMAWYFCMLNSG